ncbi:MAG: type II secretion system F family protein [Planctomycetes bacterium]|nr:type II secretion system F family protein [Planctomycetota bacterium]
MPIYEYKAYSSGGATKTGVVDADTPREARQRLRRDNILVSELRELRSGTRKGSSKPVQGVSAPRRGAAWLAKLKTLRESRTGPVGRNLELVAGVTRQMGTMLGAGIPMAEMLSAVIDQAETRAQETMFRTLRERITQGVSFGDALAEYPAYFSELYVNMVKAGEATGQVDVVLKRLADFLQRQRALQRKVVSALTYPMLMIAIGLLVVSILMTFVVPKITDMLTDTGQVMPLPTLVLIAISDGFKRYWIVLPLGIAALSLSYSRIYKTRRGQLAIDRIKLRIPIVGDLLRKSAIARFTRTLSTLLSSGVPAVRSLEIVETVVGNRIVADATQHIRVRILEGTDIATPLKATGAFPAVVGYMVAVGEQSGQLESMLDNIADAYDEEIEVVTERITSVLEPIMIIFLAVVVGYIVWSIVLPILQVGNV